MMTHAQTLSELDYLLASYEPADPGDTLTVELDCLGDTYLVTYRTDTLEGGSDDCGRVEILHRNVAIDYQIINS